MEIQRDTARKARATSNYMGAEVTVYQEIDPSIKSEFVGYDDYQSESKISILTTEEDIVDELLTGQRGTIIVDRTPFYPTMGGQEADKGLISLNDAVFEVEDTIKLQGGKIGHVGFMKTSSLKVGDLVKLEVNKNIRENTAKNHSATHLIHKALKAVLGNHVEQAGSFVSDDRLRFDFTHFGPLSQDEIKEVEEIVNQQIALDLPICTKTMKSDEAKKAGAIALFGEKYSEDVRVVTMGDYSMELCGGTHVDHTGSIMVVKIISEAGIAAGVRRIEALTGDAVITYFKEVEDKFNKAAQIAKTKPGQLAIRIQDLLDRVKILERENEKLQNKLAKDSLKDVMDNIIEVKGVKLLLVDIANLDMNALRNTGDQIINKLGQGVIVMASAQGSDKVSLLAMATDEAIKAGAHAGNLIKILSKYIGGGGGGRPNMAQAGGKNPTGIKELIENAAKVLEDQLK